MGEREGRRGGETEGLGESEERESEGERERESGLRERGGRRYFGRFIPYVGHFKGRFDHQPPLQIETLRAASD